MFAPTVKQHFFFHVAEIVKPECCTCNQGQVLRQTRWENVVEYSSNETFDNILQTLKVTGYTCKTSLDFCQITV